MDEIESTTFDRKGVLSDLIGRIKEENHVIAITNHPERIQLDEIKLFTKIVSFPMPDGMRNKKFLERKFPTLKMEEIEKLNSILIKKPSSMSDLNSYILQMQLNELRNLIKNTNFEILDQNLQLDFKMLENTFENCNPSLKESDLKKYQEFESQHSIPILPINWYPQIHFLFDSDFKDAVFRFLLILQEMKNTKKIKLPKFLLFEILKILKMKFYEK